MSFRYRLFADETKPELPLREAPGSLSIDLNLDHEPRGLLSSARSHETSLSSLTAAPVANCHSSRPRPNYTGTFQCHSTSERVYFRDQSSDGSDRGSRSSGCLVMFVVVLLFALLGRCVAQRSTGRRGFGGFRSRCASPRASRWSARPHDPCAEVRKAAGIFASSLLWFRASRLAGVCRSSGKKSRFFRHSTFAFGSFLIPPLALLSYAGPDSWGVLRGPFADSGFSLNLHVEFPLLLPGGLGGCDDHGDRQGRAAEALPRIRLPRASVRRLLRACGVHPRLHRGREADWLGLQHPRRRGGHARSGCDGADSRRHQTTPRAHRRAHGRARRHRERMQQLGR